MQTVNLSKVIAPCFYSVHKSILNHDYEIYRLKGGRGSTKSSFIAAEVLNLVMRYEFVCAVVLMKQGNRLRNGAYNLYLQAISRLGLDSYFKKSLSPMKITYKPTGQYILFIGLDDAMKTKGITTDREDRYFAVTHFEELDQFKGETEISIALQSLQRGGDLYWCFQCYNPPQNRYNWCNVSSNKDVEGRLVHTSDYRMIDPSWLGVGFYNEMRRVRARSELDYRWMYLGEATGTGGAVFKNIKEIELSDEDLRNFDNHFNGQDWGFSPDPAAFVRWHLDLANDSIYACAESIRYECQMAQVAQDILDNGFNDVYTIIDSARGGEMLSEFRNVGVLCNNMYKGRSGQLSREFGIQWLATRKNIFIDKRRTPQIFEEFSGYEYQRDKHDPDKFLSQPITFNDHTIDATRYALSPHYQVYGDAYYGEQG